MTTQDFIASVRKTFIVPTRKTDKRPPQSRAYGDMSGITSKTIPTVQHFKQSIVTCHLGKRHDLPKAVITYVETQNEDGYILVYATTDINETSESVVGYYCLVDAFKVDRQEWSNFAVHKTMNELTLVGLRKGMGESQAVLKVQLAEDSAIRISDLRLNWPQGITQTYELATELGVAHYVKVLKQPDQDREEASEGTATEEASVQTQEVVEAATTDNHSESLVDKDLPDEPPSQEPDNLRYTVGKETLPMKMKNKDASVGNQLPEGGYAIRFDGIDETEYPSMVVAVDPDGVEFAFSITEEYVQDVRREVGLAANPEYATLVHVAFYRTQNDEDLMIAYRYSKTYKAYFMAAVVRVPKKAEVQLLKSKSLQTKHSLFFSIEDPDHPECELVLEFRPKEDASEGLWIDVWCPERSLSHRFLINIYGTLLYLDASSLIEEFEFRSEWVTPVEGTPHKAEPKPTWYASDLNPKDAPTPEAVKDRFEQLVAPKPSAEPAWLYEDSVASQDEINAATIREDQALINLVKLMEFTSTYRPASSEMSVVAANLRRFKAEVGRGSYEQRLARTRYFEDFIKMTVRSLAL